MKALVSARLSNTTDSSTSVERQVEVGRALAVSLGATDITVVVDEDVSGAVSPFVRPELGKYLVEGAEQFDYLVAWKLDRVSRSALDALQLVKWLDARGRYLVTTDGINTREQQGRLTLTILAAVAEAEREAIKLRTAQSRVKLRSLGRHSHGVTPYGYTAVKRPEGGYVWKQVPEHADVLREIIERVIAGESLRGICTDLNQRGVPGPKPSRSKDPAKQLGWRVTPLRQMLTSEALLGHWHTTPPCPNAGNCGDPKCTRETPRRHPKDRHVVAEDGVAVLFTDEPIIDAATWSKLQAAVAARSKPHGPSRKVGLSGVVRCGLCGSRLVGLGSGGENAAYSLGCKNRAAHDGAGNNTIRAHLVEDRVRDYIGSQFDGVNYGWWEKPAGADTGGYANAVAEAEGRLGRLLSDRENGVYDAMPDRFTAKLAEFTAALQTAKGKLSDVEAQQVTRWHDTGVEWAAYFDDASPDERRKMLDDAGVVIELAGANGKRVADPRKRVSIWVNDQP